MAKNTGDGHRKGTVKSRVQLKNPISGKYVKLDSNTGRILSEKSTAGPFKGIRDITKKK
ncbi:hypothetical protein MKK67_06735 [Methylobacterium sp. J-072]|uniref:hypothetical protein n=1 Tax=Methylobacterium sp. J-072 TaxID=2836651 RepID=UPI001FBB27FD|nr:hypothetical protein [Methylobacterium sp. J-072]MCJ2092192.1 hypothetical protein [Methylobacterium sp. J-072]